MSQTKRHLVQFVQDTRVATRQGQITRFRAGEPKAVNEAVYRQALLQGGIPGDAKVTIEPNPPAGDSGEGSDPSDGHLLALARAIREVIDEADPDSITSDGQPKMEVLRSMVDFPVDQGMRDEARKLLEQEIV